MANCNKMDFIFYFIKITVNTCSKTAFNILVAPSFYGGYVRRYDISVLDILNTH